MVDVRFDPSTLTGMRQLMRSDMARVYEVMDDSSSRFKRLFWALFPNCQAMLWYRLSRFLYLRNWRTTAWTLHLLAIYLFRVEIPPTTSIGPYFLLGHASGCRLAGVIGQRFTILGGDSGTGGMGEDDEHGRGEPIIGDDVTMGVGALVLGPVHIGDGVRIGPRAVVTEDVPAGALVLWAKHRVIRDTPTHPATA